VDIQGFLGNNVLGRYALGIDGASSTYHLWPVSSPWAEVDRWVRVGIELTWRDGGYPVEYVLSPSDAADQGIAVGDLLLTIDGVDVTTVGGLSEIHAALRGTPGETRHLTLDGAAGTYEVEVQIQDLLP
jgi:C-terminal processing protease CtpA/Prc